MPLGPINENAPENRAPDRAAYEVPGQEQLEGAIDEQANNPLEAPDFTQFNELFAQQNEYLQYLNDISEGRQMTAGQQEAQVELQSAQAQAKGLAQSARGVNASLALRQTNFTQANVQAQTLARTAQVAARERLAAQSDAQNVLSQMAQEQQSAQNLQLRYEEAEAARQNAVIGNRISLSNLQQTSSIAYNQALANYEQAQKRDAIRITQDQDRKKLLLITGSLKAVGAGAAVALGILSTPFTAGVGTAGGIAGGVGLATAAGSDFAAAASIK